MLETLPLRVWVAGAAFFAAVIGGALFYEIWMRRNAPARPQDAGGGGDGSIADLFDGGDGSD